MRGWLVVIALATGCVFGGDDTSGGPYISIVELNDAIRAAECQYLVRCHQIADQATCLAMHDVEVPLDRSVIDSVRNARVTYRGEAMAACIDALATQSCDPADVAHRTSLDWCVWQVFSGTLHQGAACTGDRECISQHCDVCQSSESQCCLGSCVGDVAPAHPPAAAIGEACQFTTPGDPCVDGAFCDHGRCAALRAEGVACVQSSECVVGLTCTGTPTEVCTQLPHFGEPCTGRCSELGTSCGSDMTCVANAHAGDDCTQGQVCDPFSECDFNTGHCLSGPHLHESCTSPLPCNEAGTYCSFPGNTCELLHPDGETCGSNEECASGTCDPTGLTCTKRSVCPTT